MQDELQARLWFGHTALIDIDAALDKLDTILHGLQGQMLEKETKIRALCEELDMLKGNVSKLQDKINETEAHRRGQKRENDETAVDLALRSATHWSDLYTKYLSVTRADEQLEEQVLRSTLYFLRGRDSHVVLEDGAPVYSRRGCVSMPLICAYQEMLEYGTTNKS